MNIVKEYAIEIRITQQDKHYGCDIVAHHGTLLCGCEAEHAHPNDAIFAMLHVLALKNNFSGCLEAATV